MKIKNTKLLDAFWPVIHNLDSAKKAVQQGWVAAALCSGVTLIGVILNWFGITWIIQDSMALVDGLLFAAIGWGILAKNSKTVAVAGLLLYILERVYSWSNQGPKNPVMAIIFTLMFINAVRGTFAYHRLALGKYPEEKSA